MRTRSVRSLLIAGALLTLFAGSASALEKMAEGVFRLDFDRIDDLLMLPRHPDVAVLIVEDSAPRAVSDAHIKVVRQWVESGGVVWVAGDGLESAVAGNLAPFQMSRFDYVKASTGKRGGELVVRGVSPRLRIADHALTVGVDQLYLFARHKFDGTQRAEPLVEMTDTEGNHGLVLAAVPIGHGYLVLDGTARKNRMLFGRLPGFDPKHPNRLKQDSGWNGYDWDRLQANALEHARQALRTGETGAPVGR
jgi:hypothetical protein